MGLEEWSGAAAPVPAAPDPDPAAAAQAPDNDGGMPSMERRICLVGALGQDEELVLAAESFGLPVESSETGEEFMEDDANVITHFVLESFEGAIFDTLRKSPNHRILGPTAMLQLWRQQETQLPNNIRPLYCLSMRSAYICFTGFRVREELTYLITLIHNMGGSIRKDMSARVTHLIANRSGGEKYRYSTAFRVPVIGRAWVERFWEDRRNVDLKAADESLLNEYKLKVFLGSKLCFIGFSEEERQHMNEILVQNGGETAILEDPTCSHVVVANGWMYDCSLPSQSFLQIPLSDVHPAYLSCGPLKSEERKEKYFDEEKPLPMMGVDECDQTIFGPRKIAFLNDPENVTANLSISKNGQFDMSESPILRTLFYPDEENVDVTLPSMNSVENDDFKILPGKKRPRSPIETNAGSATVKKLMCPPDLSDKSYKSPFKKLKLKNSFRFKSKDNSLSDKPASNYSIKNKVKEFSDFCSLAPKRDMNTSDCTISTISPEKDDHNASMSSINSFAKTEKSFFSSSGIFDISTSSLRQSKTMKSVSKIRRGMKSISASFRGERKRKYEKRSKDDSDCESPTRKCFIEKRGKQQMMFDISPLSNTSLESVNTQLAHISEHSELNITLNNTNVKVSPEIFKTPKNKISFKKHRHTLCGATPAASSPIASNIITSPAIFTNFGASETTYEPSHLLNPKKCNPEARFKNNVKIPLDCSILSVVDEHNTQSLPDVGVTTHIVRAEWFWISVQNEEAQDEKDYLFEDYLESQTSPSRRSSRGSLSSSASGTGGTSPPRSPGPGSRTPASVTHSSQRVRKRKLRGPEGALHKRRSSVGDAVLLSLSANLLDCTQSPDGKQSILDEVECVNVSDAARKHMSPRQQVFMELVQTESNYVGILHTIVTIFKQPLEEMTNEDDPSKALLNNTELKIIFGNLVPIYEIHRRMLEELKWSSHNWGEEISIGRIILKYAPDLVKAYPPFVNFFENMKEMLVQCDREKPRFHAFLKGRQTKPECGRQTLQELLIRPVQRLPSISLLLDDVLKHTSKSNPDHSALESALMGIREIMTHVNEDKRKTEGQLQMFDIYNEIDNCPPHLVSSHRSFVARCEVVELSKDLSGRGDNLVLFLFTDTMEVCKKRSKVFNSKSPPLNGLHHAASKLGSGKSYRHVQLMPLSTVKRVIDIRESDDCHKVFALMCRSNQELKEKLYSFAITDEAVDKTQFLKQLCRQMANTVCKADADKFLACLESHQLDIDTSDFTIGTLSKVSKFASRTRLKVGRAFSFNKTPSKLKRAVSSMISPFGSTSNLTPASQLAQMRLASCNNINELGVTNSGQSETLVAPMSVQPTRKAKTGSLSASALRRL